MPKYLPFFLKRRFRVIEIAYLPSLIHRQRDSRFVGQVAGSPGDGKRVSPGRRSCGRWGANAPTTARCQTSQTDNAKGYEGEGSLRA